MARSYDLQWKNTEIQVFGDMRCDKISDSVHSAHFKHNKVHYSGSGPVSFTLIWYERKVSLLLCCIAFSSWRAKCWIVYVSESEFLFLDQLEEHVSFSQFYHYFSCSKKQPLLKIWSPAEPSPPDFGLWPYSTEQWGWLVGSVRARNIFEDQEISLYQLGLCQFDNGAVWL